MSVRSLPRLSGSKLLSCLVVGGVVLASCGGGDDKAGKTTATATTTEGQVTTTTSENTYESTKYGVSFRYPAGWERKDVEKPGIAAFGDDDSSCSLVFYRGGAPSSTDSQSLQDFAQRRARKAERKATDYDLKSIQEENGENVTGIGILRTSTTTDAGSKGAHIAYFFPGGNRYIFDCTTDPDLLEEADETLFKPLISSIRIDPPANLKRSTKKKRAKKSTTSSGKSMSRAESEAAIKAAVTKVSNVADEAIVNVVEGHPVDIRIGVLSDSEVIETFKDVVEASQSVLPTKDVKVTAADPNGEFVGWAEWNAAQNQGYMHPPTGPSVSFELAG